MSVIEQVRERSVKNQSIRNEAMQSIIPLAIELLSQDLIDYADTTSERSYKMWVRDLLYNGKEKIPTIIGLQWEKKIGYMQPSTPTEGEWTALKDAIIAHFEKDFTLSPNSFWITFEW